MGHFYKLIGMLACVIYESLIAQQMDVEHAMDESPLYRAIASDWRTSHLDDTREDACGT